MTSHSKISRIFIANRGEIARRIATTARRLGIESVAISDREHPPAYLSEVVTYIHKVADESPAIYLNIEQMLTIAKETKCDALHPGFGFLSESDVFAKAVIDAGLIWIGPCPSSISAMASKSTARDYAQAAGVPCIRGLSGFHVPESENGDFSQIEKFAEETGYPLLMKAAYGGGGKGMRLVHKLADVRPAALRAHSEAINSFGNGMLICEQYLTAPRHIEVQILADKHGQVFAVGDRDCSMQRRHQKIIEEAPAPDISAETRKEMHTAATALAARVGYDSAGTVEFLLDWSDAARKSKKQSFYFLEMNTRLQVEHPVSEEVFGIDLVEWQIRVAQNEKIPPQTVHSEPRGHSIELRIYAEDTANNFFPAPGPVAAFLPATGPGIRWETGLDAMDEITGKFDPMIAKLIATAANREGALERLTDILARTFFAGPVNNIPLLTELVAHSKFKVGPVTTHFIQDNLAAMTAAIESRAKAAESGAELAFTALKNGDLPPKAFTDQRLSTTAISNWVFSGNSSTQQKTSKDKSRSLINGTLTSPSFPGRQTSYGCTRIEHADGKPVLIWYASLSSHTGKDLWVLNSGSLFHRNATRTRTNHDSGAGSETAGAVLAPVPGKVIAVKAKEGFAINAGDTVFILESMKMEFEVKAARSGTIKAVKVTTGIQVTAGETLAEWQD
jgi:acetyl/propionyl-CoA carboxylase alpha subunit